MKGSKSYNNQYAENFIGFDESFSSEIGDGPNKE